jgi:hypothetical protein
MKTLKLLLLPLLLGASFLSTRGADINPAFLYYRAFLLSPTLSQSDSDYLYTNNWRGQKLPERLGKLVEGYDDEFKMARQAAQSSMPCDWGIDMSAGPQTLFPQLARAKGLALAAQLRVPWHLQNGNQAQARDDLLTTFALARNLPRDGTLISMLVQFAIEAIASSTIAQNFGQFSPATLQQLADGLDALPPRRTVAESVESEKALFLDRTIQKILELQRQNPGNDARVMEETHEFMGFNNEVQGTLWEPLTNAAGGTSDGILRLLRDEEGFYDSFTNFLRLPYSEFKAQKPVFLEQMKSSNPLVTTIGPALVKAREREFRILATLAILRAGIDHKLHGESTLAAAIDPCGDGPLAFSRFSFEGVDRGFELKSTFNLGGNQAVLIFVEKSGPPFQVDGNYPGRPLAQVAPGQ